MVYNLRVLGSGGKTTVRGPFAGTTMTNARILMVGADLRWSRAIRAAAQELGGIAVETVPSGRVALTCLLDPHLVYTHLLLNPARDDGLGRSILGITCEEDGSGCEMLLLGRSAGMPSHACVIPGPTREAIRMALMMGCRDAPRAPPSVAALRGALADGRIETRYQPLVRMKSGALAGFEALARLFRVGQGMLSPEYFVPRIEHAGLAGELTRLVSARSLADMASLAPGLPDATVALNFPLDVLLLPDALRQLDADREAAGIARKRIVIELTESRAVDDVPQLRRVVDRLLDTGYRTALDDISPGMPHYEALLDIPFTAVKLDRDIVLRSAQTKADSDFVKRVIAAARQRGMNVVVEGVEDARTWHRMRKAGADLAQGFVVGRPMPAAVLPAWLEAWRARTDLD
jgi:EAL domain-containing protein (putative c-di-GMP-specific phosphodiesterase class I)